jgi:hypothetical protein
MTAISGMRTARLAGCLLGMVLAGILVLASRPVSGGAAVGAAVNLYANQTGELAVDPAGPADFLTVSELRPGASASGNFRVTNQTGVREALVLGARPSSHELDYSLAIEIRAGSTTLYSGTLGSLSEATPVPLLLDPGDTATVTVTVSLSGQTGPELAAALVGIAIVFDAAPPAEYGVAA